PWTGRRAHAVVHGGSLGEATGPLFSRWKSAPPVGAHTGRDRREPAERRQWHAVLPGDTLWSIAAERLGTDDVRRIARYWPRIHRANREVIGANPDLIRPGQVLELPPEHA
ncbi:MAG: LysM peptidoglycan-binding domain-containing protein, partial [Actinomycetota bacterium]|nr:LysM peptidoglycan-binding domain-containing protein [Actinomycetota bacterium]